MKYLVFMFLMVSFSAMADTVSGYGHTVSVRNLNNQFQIIADGKVLSSDAEYDSAQVESYYQTADTVYALVEYSSGGVACPMLYRTVAFTDSGAKISPMFGTCSDLAKTAIDGKSLVVGLPNMVNKLATLYYFENGDMQEMLGLPDSDGNIHAVDLRKDIDPTQALDISLIKELVDEKTASSTVSAVSQILELGVSSGAWVKVGKYIVFSACAPHECGINEAAIVLSSTDAWVAQYYNGQITGSSGIPKQVMDFLKRELSS